MDSVSRLLSFKKHLALQGQDQLKNLGFPWPETADVFREDITESQASPFLEIRLPNLG